MKGDGAYEAKIHLSELLAKVAAGATVEITRFGTPVARLVPVRNEFAGPAAAIEEWERYRDDHNVILADGTSICDHIEEGRE